MSEPIEGLLCEASPISLRPTFVELADTDGPVWVNPHYVAAIQPHPAGDHTYVWLANSHTLMTPGALLVTLKAPEVIARLNGASE